MRAPLATSSSLDAHFHLLLLSFLVILSLQANFPNYNASSLNSSPRLSRVLALGACAGSLNHGEGNLNAMNFSSFSSFAVPRSLIRNTCLRLLRSTKELPTHAGFPLCYQRGVCVCVTLCTKEP